METSLNRTHAVLVFNKVFLRNFAAEHSSIGVYKIWQYFYSIVRYIAREQEVPWNRA